MYDKRMNVQPHTHHKTDGRFFVQLARIAGRGGVRRPRRENRACNRLFQATQRIERHARIHERPDQRSGKAVLQQ